MALVIPRRFNGPPQSANGGYTCGLLAVELGGVAEVALRKPPPLDTPLDVAWSESSLELRNGAELVAEAWVTEVEVELPEPVSLADAETARKRYAGFRHHAYPTCFTCGPDRSDGLAIFAGPVEGREGVVAAPWVPAARHIAPPLVWAALDCPSGWAVDDFQREGVLLGRMAAKRLSDFEGGQPYVVVGWRAGEEGRKRYAGSALFSADGDALAVARSTWIVPSPV